MATSKPTLAVIRKFTLGQAARLGLAEWKFSIRWATKADFEAGRCGEDCEATISWQIEHKSAIVLLNRKQLSNWQTTMCHEIIHLRLEGHMDQPFKYNSHYEHALNVLASLLAPAAQEASANAQ